MGNSQNIDVGTNATMHISREMERYRKFYGHEHEAACEYWLVSYHAGKTFVQLSLNIIYDEYGDIKLLKFSFAAPKLITFVLDRAKNKNQIFQIDRLINQIEIQDSEKSNGTRFFNETKNHWGGVTKTNVIYHGYENEENLILVEQKRKRGVEKSGAVRVAHYYATSRENVFLKKIDVGLSTEVVITVLNNNGLDVSMKGPSEHPSMTLLQMFQQVSTTRIWKWKACPDGGVVTQRRQHFCKDRQLVEIEPETETDTENDDEERNDPQLHIQIGGCIIKNQGVIKGNNNGNVFAKYLNIFLFGSTKEREGFLMEWMERKLRRQEGGNGF